MKGSIKTMADGVHRLRVDVGPGADGKRKQKMITYRGRKQDAQKKLRDLLTALDDGVYVEPTKLTIGQWLGEWLTTSVNPRVRPSTYVRYKGIIENSIQTADLANVPLQRLRPAHIEAYYAGAKVSASTLSLHHTILHSALRKAVRDRLIAVNPARDLEGKPRRLHSRDEARKHCWSLSEAKLFLEIARAAGPQAGAFYTLALDSGMRKGELCGLAWADVDLDASTVRVVRQLLSPSLTIGGELRIGPTKTSKVRTVRISDETVRLLQEHRKQQRQSMMRHRDTWKDLDLVFTRDDGQPLLMNNLGQREYASLIKAANVKSIKFHGLRHTCATLLLQAGTPVHVVSERLGHSKVSMTMEVYAHVLPDMQREAAVTMGALLHGR